MAGILAFFLSAILVSFLCSMWEAVLLSVTPMYLNRQQQAGTPCGKHLAAFKKDIDRPLSAILTLNTIAHTVGAIGVGVQAEKLIGGHKMDLWLISVSYESLVAAGMTLAILVLSEIIPKTIGANMWERLTPFTTRSLRVLVTVLAPFVWMSRGITHLLQKDKGKSVFSRADFVAMAQVGEETGALARDESRIIKNLLRFESIRARDIMTPRTVVVTADETDTLSRFHDTHQPLRFSRIPIYRDTPDNITGFVLKDELLEALVEDRGDTRLESLRKSILAVAPNTVLPRLFDEFTRNRTHLAVVVDEYGSLVGLVTMEDVVETLLGLEIVDELDDVADMQELARQRWKARARKMGIAE